MRDEDLDFSRLKTVSSFDLGNDQTMAVDVPPQELQNFSPSSLLIESLIEQICSLMEKEPSNQRKLYLAVCEKLHQMNLIGESYEKEEFQFMRSHYQNALYHLLAIAKSTAAENKIILPNNKSRLSIAKPSKPLELSRYHTEFKELEFIAKGGFGRVYKAQHKLDGEIYAIKKIYLRYRSVSHFLRNLREVKMLAKLNHPNIVAYKAAWLEASGEAERASCVEVSSSDTTTTTKTGSITQTNDSLDVVFEYSEKSRADVRTGDDESEKHKFSKETFESSTTSISENGEKQICQIGEAKYQFTMDSLATVQQSAILYIQMQLCHKTLRQWLDCRNDELAEICPEQILEVFKQIVRGVEYIHSQGIVHHDIKPSNIFVSDDLRLVQVGDFGLACRLLAHSQPSGVVFSHQPGQLGTKLYAAPEQLRGGCHAKSDVYSLGIVLFELIQPFCTAMERSKLISQLRGGHIPIELTAKYNNIAMIISQTVTSLNKRPTSSELLDNIKEIRHAKFNKNSDEHLSTINELKRESLAKDEEIALLKQQLEELSKRFGQINDPKPST